MTCCFRPDSRDFDLDVRIYVLFEHQSSRRNDMPLRMLGYMLRIWEQCQKRAPARSLPIIFPVVLSHDPRGWSGPTRFGELLEPSLKERPELAAYVPDFRFLLEDLTTRSDADIRGLALPPFPTLSVWLMRDGRIGSKVSAGLAHWGNDLVQLLSAPGGENVLAQLLAYIELVTEDLDLPKIRGKLAELHPRVERIAMTIADQIRAEVNRVDKPKWQRETLYKLLKLRFRHTPSEKQSEIIEAGTNQQLDLWIERVLTAANIDEVLVLTRIDGDLHDHR